MKIQQPKRVSRQFVLVGLELKERRQHSRLRLRPPASAHLRADVEVAVDGQNRVAPVLNGLREQSVAAALQEPFEQELGRGVQEGLLAVRGANILWRADRGGVFHLLEAGGSTQFGVKGRFIQISSRFCWCGCSNTYHEFGFDQEVFVSAHWNVFLHEAEVVEAAQQQPTAVHPQIEVHLLAAVPAHGTGNWRYAVD